jgi:hypothetical protein
VFSAWRAAGKVCIAVQLSTKSLARR